MLNRDLMIKKYPYLAYSQNMIEYFAIIGYPEKLVPQILDTQRKKFNNFSPKLLSAVTSTSDYGIVDNNLIISQIYPENPLVILINKNAPDQDPPPPSNVIYSFCFDSQDGKEKLFHVCYAYKFYEKYKYYKTNNKYEEYYIPKAFCIISQYYYFHFFQYICKNIYSLIELKNQNPIPTEITAYNIVNFIPSPMNYSLHLDLFSYALNVSNVEIEQLSGYPYIDIDLSQIFNLIPLYLFLQVYLITFLEISMIFFSSNLELLNMVMFILYILNYPCNDSTYFWHIVSISKDNFVDENKFVGKIMVSIIGLNANYSEDIDTSPFGKYHYIFDIDNKKLILKKPLDLSDDEDENDFENLRYLQNYIENIIKDKIEDSIFLKPFIERLRKSLEFVLSKNPDFSLNPKNKYVDFFYSSKEILEQNKKIQEIFYDFCLNILTLFYQDNSLNSSFDKIKKDREEESDKRLYKIRNIPEDTQMNINERNFCNLFRNSVKYKIYFENFIKNLESIEIFKIPLFFSEEFINIKSVDISNKIINKLSLFNIIDSFYYSNQHATINITLNNIFSDYLERLKKFFKPFLIPESSNNNQLIKFNKKIINKYIYLLNNFYDKDELRDLFPSIRIKEGDLIPLIDRRYIANTIQNIIEQKNLIELNNYLIYAMVYIFSIAIPLHSYKKMLMYLDDLIKGLNEIKVFTRKYVFILIKSFYQYYFIHKTEQIYPDLRISNIKMYFFNLIYFLKKKLILPNEEMMLILKNFFTKLIYQERDSIEIKKGKEVDNEANFEIENNKNFLCFMKHCFTSKKCFNISTMVKSAIKENNNCNIIIMAGKKQIQPTVEIKIKEYHYSSEFFAPKKCYKLIQQTFNKFYSENFNMKKLKINVVRDVMANLILYGIELNKSKEIIPVDFLIYSLYLFKNHEKKNGNGFNIAKK